MSSCDICDCDELAVSEPDSVESLRIELGRARHEHRLVSDRSERATSELAAANTKLAEQDRQLRELSGVRSECEARRKLCECYETELKAEQSKTEQAKRLAELNDQERREWARAATKAQLQLRVLRHRFAAAFAGRLPVAKKSRAKKRASRK